MFLTANDESAGGFAVYQVDLATGIVKKIIEFPNTLVEVEGLALSQSPQGLTIDALGVVPTDKKNRLTRRMDLFTFSASEN